METEVKSVFGCAENYEVHERKAWLFYFYFLLLYLFFALWEFSSSNIPATCEMGA